MRRVMIALAAATAAVGLVVTTAGPASAAFPGGNGKLLYTDVNEIFTFDSGAGSRFLASGNLPAYSADGAKIAFVRACELFVMDGDGANVSQLTNGGNCDDAAHSWSPDGTKLAFVRQDPDGETSTIMVIGSDGSNETVIAAAGSRNYNTWPAWSPDGTKIAFTHTVNDDEKSDIYVINADGTGETNLTAVSDGTYYYYNPDWAPDGSQLVFTQHYGGYEGSPLGGVYLVNADGSNLHAILTTAPNPMPGATWSPDGAKIAYTVRVGGNHQGDIFVMDADGTNRQNVTNTNDSDEILRDWQPSPAGGPVTVPPGALPSTTLRVVEGFDVAADGTLAETGILSGDPDYGQTDLFVAPPGGGLTRVTYDDLSEGLPSIADNHKVVYSLRGQVIVRNGDGSGRVALTGGGSSCGGAAVEIAPDASFVLYTDCQGTMHKINADGSNDVPLTPANIGFGEGEISADGTQIAAYCYVPYSNQSGICTLGSDGSNLAFVLTNGVDFGWGTPTWSPDGAHLAAVRSYNYDPFTGASDFDLYFFGSDGSNPELLPTPAADRKQSPRWFPDGRIGYVSHTGGWQQGTYTSEILFVSPPVPDAPSFTVNTTDDVVDAAGCTTGHCSLREAIIRANALPGTDTIGFDIPGLPGLVSHTITPTSALPPVIDPVIIDGTTEPDFTSCADGPVIELDGSSAGASADGIWLAAVSTLRGLVINRFTGPGRAGVVISSAGAAVECSYIGTDVTGTADLGNTIGVFLQSASTVGAASAGNLISGNDVGVYISGTGGHILGNLIGTDAAGTADLGNFFGGIIIDGGSSNTIGGTATGEGNVISGNDEDGVRIGGPSNQVIGNVIGTDLNGTGALGNSQMGIMIVSSGGANDNVIGGEGAGAGNVIAFNGMAGVFIQDRTGNKIVGDSIFSNGDLGIDLGGGPVTPNDSGDGDSGPNNLQNFPVLTSATSGGGTTTVEGTLNSNPSAAGITYRVEFFSNSECDPSGNGEGAVFLGFEDVTTDPGGDASFTATLSSAVAIGDAVTATATDPAGNTSEFSGCQEATAPTAAADVSITMDDSPDPVTAGESLTYTLTVENLGPSDAQSVVVTETLPAGTTFVSASDSGSYDLGSNAVTWDLGVLGTAQPPRQLTLVVQVDAARTADLVTTATITTSSSDSDATNDSTVEVTAVSPPPPPPVHAGVWSWGNNNFGQLGDGTATNQLVPVLAPNLSNAVQVSAGFVFGVALLDDGTVRSWGTNYRNALGQLGSLTDIVDIATGVEHGLALDTSGRVWAWGRNWEGQLGDGTFQNRAAPAVVTGVSNVVAIAAGGWNSVALTADGQVYAWGSNPYGQLGNGTRITSPTPGQVNGLPPIVAIAPGDYHSLALDANGEVWHWGATGTGSSDNDYLVLAPVKVEGLSEIVAIGAGGGTSLAIDSSGHVWQWFSIAPTPAIVPGLSDIVAVDGGSNDSFAVALGDDGSVWAWGDNTFGELGDGTTVAHLDPRRVPGLGGVTAVSAGYYGFVLAVGSGSPTGVTDETASADAATGETVTTDDEADGATADDRVETAVTTPTAGPVSITEKPNSIAPTGYALLGSLVKIEAPDATVDAPLILRFQLDASAVPVGVTPSEIAVFRNGTLVLGCSGAGANPDPCKASATLAPDGDVELVVRTSQASDWTFGIGAPQAHAGGPYEIQEGSSLTLAGSGSDGEAPLAFQWSPNFGLDADSSATPIFTGADDGVFPLTLLVTDANGAGSADLTEVTVTNAEPELSPLELVPGSPLAVGTEVAASAAFTDPGVLDTHEATIDWGDGETTYSTVDEQDGSGTTGGSHTYEQAGTYTVTLTVNDDDGGSTQVSVEVVVAAGDETPPTVTCGMAPTFLLNEPSATVSATVTDDGSGPVSATVSAPVSTTQVGAFAVALTGEDEAGHTTTVSCPYRVSYRFEGFFAPIDNLPIVNKATAGQTIPVKWRISDYNGVGISDPASFVSVTSGSATCSAGDLIDVVETYSGVSGLQYLGDGRWQFNWKTPKTYAGQCRVMRLNLADGATGRIAELQFK